MPVYLKGSQGDNNSPKEPQSHTSKFAIVVHDDIITATADHCDVIIQKCTAATFASIFFSDCGLACVSVPWLYLGTSLIMKH